MARSQYPLGWFLDNTQPWKSVDHKAMKAETSFVRLMCKSMLKQAKEISASLSSLRGKKSLHSQPDVGR